MELCHRMWKCALIAACLVMWIRLGSGVEVCPGGSANLTCTVTDSTRIGSTAWKGDSSVFDCASWSVLLSHTVAMATDDCGPLAVGRIIAAVGNNFTSVLTVTAPDINGSLLDVRCTLPQPLGMPAVVFMEYNVTVTGPPTFVPTLSVSEIMRVGESDQWEFNLEWEVPPEHCDLDFVITADPPLPPSDQCTVDCTTQCRVFTLGLDDPHNLTVTAQNCGGTQNGTESEHIEVCLQLPGGPEVSSSLTYRRVESGQLGGILQTIDLTWNSPVPKHPVVDMADNPIVSGDVEYYLVTETGMETKYLNSSTTWYTADVSQRTQPEYTVSIAAMNDVGVGSPTNSGLYSANNDFFDIRWDDNCTFVVTCRSRFDSYNVTVDPGFSDTMVPCNTSSSVMLNRSNGSAVEYDYTVQARNGSLEVVVKGTFDEAECDTTSPPDDDGDGGGSDITGAVVGGVIGALVVIAVACGIVVLVIILLWKKDTNKGNESRDGNATDSQGTSEKLEMEAQHYGKLQHTMGSPSSADPTGDPMYSHLNVDEADEVTGQEYSQLRHGTQPHAVPNPEQPGYSHLDRSPQEGDQYAEVKNDRRKWW